MWVITNMEVRKWVIINMEGNLCLREQKDILCTMPCVAEWIIT